MTIHTEHPFADNDPQRDAVRQLRGRLGGVVSLWTAGTKGNGAGLTISSLAVVQGEPGRVVAFVDPLSEFVDHLRRTGTAVVHLLSWHQTELAEVFAGRSPAPGGVFGAAEFVDTDHGPRLVDPCTWATVRLEDEREIGWSVQVTCVIEDVMTADDVDPLVHRRGRYRRARDADS
ncbi:flavin reductase family protein [Nocardioides yefusunii]|uniref:Flavin reductase family protein n=1 Tax=Nocardioides yefusunii TaxID=2500546 RepID=A0ABW1QWW0_9ACTN|nr:flavin reductase [Nocardioides yefusunii]